MKKSSLIIFTISTLIALTGCTSTQVQEPPTQESQVQEEPQTNCCGEEVQEEPISEDSCCSKEPISEDYIPNIEINGEDFSFEE